MYREYIKKNSSKHTRKHLKIALILFCVVIACVGSAAAVLEAKRIWERQISAATFVVGSYDSGVPGNPGETGTLSAFLAPSWEAYRAQTEKLNLLDHSTLLTITESSVPGPLMIEITYTCSGDATLVCEGVYVELFRAADVRVVNPVSEPFNIPLDSTPVILAGRMNWADCYLSGVKGYALQLNFSIVAEGLPTGSYDSNILIGLCIAC